MRIAKDRIEVKMDIPGAKLRLQSGFGDTTGFDRFSAEYFSLAAGVDTAPLFEGLHGNLCHCPHWGFVVRGRLTTTDGEGTEETVQTHDLFYWPPGHNVRVEEDAEIVMFSPQLQHLQVIDHMKQRVAASGAPS
jgi:hypothetical protein